MSHHFRLGKAHVVLTIGSRDAVNNFTEQSRISSALNPCQFDNADTQRLVHFKFTDASHERANAPVSGLESLSENCSFKESQNSLTVSISPPDCYSNIECGRVSLTKNPRVR